MNKQAPEPKSIVIFLHIPKAAGTTLYDILNREYGRTRIYTFHGGRHRLQESIKRFQILPEACRNRLRLVRGHVAFGVHDLLPGRPYTYITILRDPVARVVSHYQYVCRNTNHLLHKAVVAQGMDLETYVTSGINYELDNGQTRQIAGVEDRIPFGACHSGLLEQAQNNLEKAFSVVGVMENFDETLLLMQRELGWRREPAYTRQNASRAELPISAATRRLIVEFNRFDMELYSYVRDRFSGQRPLLAASQLDAFRRRNAQYARHARGRAIVRSTLKTCKTVVAWTAGRSS